MPRHLEPGQARRTQINLRLEPGLDIAIGQRGAQVGDDGVALGHRLFHRGANHRGLPSLRALAAISARSAWRTSRSIVALPSSMRVSAMAARGVSSCSTSRTG